MLEYTFKNQDLLSKALTHPSLSNNGTQSSSHYERLEFLGDRVLSLIIAEILFTKHYEMNEGELAITHANLVNSKCISDIANKIGLGKLLLMDHGEESIGGRTNPKNLENAMEALIGAIYLDSNYETTAKVVSRLWEDYINISESMNKRDSKSELQEWCQHNHLPLPEYKVESKIGPSHKPIFMVSVYVPGLDKAIGEGGSKKTAELNAAYNILKTLQSI